MAMMKLRKEGRKNGAFYYNFTGEIHENANHRKVVRFVMISILK